MAAQKRQPDAESGGAASDESDRDEAAESERDEKAVEVEEEEDDDEDEDVKVEMDEDEEEGEGEEDENENENDQGDDDGDEEEEEEENEQRPKEEENGEVEDREDGESGSSPSAGPADDSEFILVKLADIRKEVQCPICLGIIKKTRTVMECLHRFCRDCIDKSMRLGNNECPACRTHCASRRSLRDDPNYDALIAALYPDIEKYEEEELTFHEEEKNRNKKIQLLIAATLKRQAEALGKRRLTRNPRGRNRSFMSFRGSQGSDDDDGVNTNDWDRDSTPTEESCIDVRPKRYKRSTPRSSRSMVTSDADEACEGNEDGDRETRSASPGRVGGREMLVWGKGGTRSQTRHGGGISGKNIKGSRISKMMDYIRSCAENENEFDVHLTLLPLGDHPALERPYLCCRPTLTIGHISQFVANQTSMEVDKVEILARKAHNLSLKSDPAAFPGTATTTEDYQILGAQESVDGIYTCFPSSLGNLVLVYRLKIPE